MAGSQFPSEVPFFLTEERGAFRPRRDTLSGKGKAAGGNTPEFTGILQKKEENCRKKYVEKTGEKWHN